MKFLMVAVSLVAVVGGSYFGFQYYGESRNEEARAISPDFLPVTQDGEDNAQEHIQHLTSVDMKQLELSLSQTEATLRELEVTLVDVPDMDAFNSKYEELSQQVSLLPAPEHLLDPANSTTTRPELLPLHQRDTWRSVMQNYGEVTGASTQHLETLFQSKSP